MEHYFQSALAPSSQRTYSSAQQRYLGFCTAAGLAPLPATERQLCQFASFLASGNLTHSTIKGYLSAVCHLHIASGLSDPGIPNMPNLEGVLKGIKAMQARAHSSARTRLPITPPIIRRIGEVWETQGPSQDHVMLWAAVTLCFFGFLRSGEVTVPSDAAFDPTAHLTFDDIKVDSITNPTSLKICFKASKTDPFRRGVDIVVGRTNDKLCPVTAVLAYLVTRGNDPGFLFKFQDGRHLTKSRFVEAVRQALGRAGFDPMAYAGHSFRIGAATTANARGINDSTIQMLGRWSSSAYLGYIRTSREQLATYSSILSQEQR